MPEKQATVEPLYVYILWKPLAKIMYIKVFLCISEVDLCKLVRDRGSDLLKG